MKFRTEIDIKAHALPQISHGEGIVMLGSCFTDSIGQLLDRDGFDVVHNPMGTLYNPVSIRHAIEYALDLRSVDEHDFVVTPDGMTHCLDFATRYTSRSRAELWEMVKADTSSLGTAMRRATSLVLTLGTAYVFERVVNGQVVGNCHKLPPQSFRRYRLTPAECTRHLQAIIDAVPANIKNIMLTVSPIRHTPDGLHGNELSKATLLLSIDSLSDPRASYFPSYEIMIDDLRDYRFYASDMKHPSDTAVDYIYEQFTEACFSAATRQKAADCRKLWLRNAHRQILNDN